MVPTRLRKGARCGLPGSRLLDDSRRTVVRPDSVQAFGGTLSSRLPTRCWGVALFRFAFRCSPCRGVAPEGTAQLTTAMPARRSLLVSAR
jgi:hypothetical protein